MQRKTQASKRQEKNEKQKQAAEQRQQLKSERAAAIQRQREEDKSNSDETIPLSKKERRKLAKKDGKKLSTEPLGNNSTGRIMSGIVSNKDVRATLALVEEKIKAEPEVSSDVSRLVENHSTYCDGLRTVLVRLQKRLLGCTIIPGKISHNDTHIELFELRYQRMVDEHTYKFVARNGRSAQDLTISVESKYLKVYTEERIQEIINDVISQESKTVDETPVDLSICYGLLNRELPKALQASQREKSKQEHAELKQRESAAEKVKKIAKIERQIRNKEIGNTSSEAIAENFYNIEYEGGGGKHAYGKHSHNSLKNS